MSHFFTYSLLVLSLWCFNMSVSGESAGYITGTLLLDEEWERVVYISKIESINKEHAVSNNMIIAQSKIDRLGHFKIDLSALPNEWCLLRIHVVKKGDPPASLIIGSMDENYCYAIANGHSQMSLRNTAGRPIFKSVAFTGASYMKTFEHILRLSQFSSSVNYIDSLIEKQFIEEVIAEKLKVIADTCNNHVVSLYALYQIDFQSDAKADPVYYERYLSNRAHLESSYLTSFRMALGVPNQSSWLWLYLILATVIGLLVYVVYLVFKTKPSKINTLSLQERKVFDLLHKGASNQDIMDELNIGLSTAKSHVSSIFSKLNIKSRKEVLHIKNE